MLSGPLNLAGDKFGNVYMVDFNNNRVRKVDSNGIISSVAGSGSTTYSSDYISATSAGLNGPVGLSLDRSAASYGVLYLVSANNNRVHAISAGGIISTVAGNGTAATTGIGGPAAASTLKAPRGLHVNLKGEVIVGTLTSGLYLIH